MVTSTNVIFDARFKVNESRYKQFVVTPHFSLEQNLLKKISRKDKYWHSQLRKAFR